MSENTASTISQTSSWNAAATCLAALLSSSCCILQLALNALSFSCAGSVDKMGASGVPDARVSTRQLLHPHPLASGLHRPHRIHPRPVRAPRRAQPQPEDRSLRPAFTPADASPVVDCVPAIMHFSVDGLKCEGCAARVQAAALAVEQVTLAETHFVELGRPAKVVVRTCAGSEQGVAQGVVMALASLDLTYRTVLMGSYVELEMGGGKKEGAGMKAF
ncbi:hypothetical protein BDK51DRAFT_36835 [Blyttiomyces helicus]|uniref:HMA domain-containing protein n=1 Tax=Blyttiomyces helicus TaxID=388810 RepID=A0A4P9W7L6_9FUNG|nr:hypothetical protein BDK51DRAFT_36835 [Blyttiomyces helicus]|eukprot:RKO88469.1 hypothetical protein BDK51DRAFT_36835 [Blyttiomyces helicus]